jgi:Cu-Zn family superoxide dismutase
MYKRKQRAMVVMLCGITAVCITAAAQAAGITRASAEIKGCDDAAVSGTAELIERPSDEGVKVVDVTLRVRGLKPGKHAVHIHETGNCTPCSAAKGHFDPGPYGFSAPDGNHPFHSGDLVNINVNASGVGYLHTSTTRVTLSPGPLSLFDADGSAIVIHTDPDTYCPQGDVKGCAGGARAACGIIKLE